MKKIAIILTVLLSFSPVHAKLSEEEKVAADKFLTDFMHLVLQYRVKVEASTLPNIYRRLEHKEILLDKNGMPGLHSKQDALQEILKLICTLTFIEKLTFIHFGAEKLPTDISQLTKLCHLNLTGNQLSELPEEMFNLTSLRELTLTLNKFERVPRAITNLVNLKRLLLWDNPLVDSSLGNDWGKIMLTGYFQETLEVGNKNADLQATITQIEKLLGGSGDAWKHKSCDQMQANIANLIQLMAGLESEF